MSKIVYVTTEALRQMIDKYSKLPEDVSFVLTSEADQGKTENYIADLEAKLAEKEKENNELVFIIEEIEQFAWEQLNNENFDKYKAYDEMLTKIKQLTRQSPYEQHNQAKTDFAIEQLLIARSRVYNFRYNESRCLNKEDSIEDCLEVLDNLIKELKEGKNGEKA